MPNKDLVLFKMAKEAIKKLDEQLNCAICLDTYTDPKLLQCFHTYCTKCLTPLVVRDRQRQQLTLTCPTCRKVTPIPTNGVGGLQSAFHINELLEIRDGLKKTKEPISAQEIVENPVISRTPSKDICSDHGKDLEYFCETCNELICYKCAVKGGKHHDHDYDPLDEAFDKYKGEITSSLEPLEKRLKTIHTALAQLNTRSAEISDQRVTIEARIHNTIGRLHEVLDVRKTELIGQLHQMTQWKLKTLATQRDEMETIQAQLSSCKEFINGSVKSSSQGAVMKMKNTIAKQVKELTTSSQPDTLKLSTVADVSFSASSEDIVPGCKNFGEIFSSGSPDPSQCHAVGKGLEVAVVGETCSVNLQAIDYNGKPCEENINSLHCELVSEITRDTVSGIFERIGQSQYEISYQPTIKGRHQLHVIVEDRHIKGSPFTVAAKLPVEKIAATPILTFGGIANPMDIVFNKDGDIVVAENNGRCVSIFNPRGEKLRSFGTRGSGQGQFENPRGMTVDGDKNILVTDDDNSHIQRFTAEGQFITSVGTKGNGPLLFGNSLRVTFNPTNNKVYVVDGNQHVQILNSDLTFSGIFGKFGSLQGEFKNPLGITCDSTGKVYVVDRYNHRIQVFTPEGEFLRMFGNRGNNQGELHLPISIAIDASDKVYVGDSNDRVSMFTSEGQFLSSFGRSGREPGEFSYPGGLAVDASGVVYASDSTNGRIQVF